MKQYEHSKRNDPLFIVVLAAGKGTRMKSSKAKVLHEVFFRPMVHHVLEATLPLRPAQTVVIVGHQSEAVQDSLTQYDITPVLQQEQLGTGHAVLMTEPVIEEGNGMVMILCGDSPLIRPDSLVKMFEQHRNGESQITVMTTIVDNPTGYGRIVSDGANVLAIVEEKETDDKQKSIKEINTGIYIVSRNLLFQALKNITADNSQGEFYLTDIIEYSVSQGLSVNKYINSNPEETLGVNSRVELEAAHAKLQFRRNRELMQQGISMQNSNSIAISPFAAIGRDTLIMQNVQITGNTTVGESCIIENGAIINNCTIGNNARIGAYSVMTNLSIEEHSSLPPFSTGNV